MWYKLATFAVATVALVGTAASAPVTITFTTTNLANQGAGSFSSNVYIYDSLGLPVNSASVSGYSYDDGSGNVTYSELYLSTDLPPGPYSFAFYGDDQMNRWTDLVTVASGTGYSGGLSFSYESAPVDPPTVIPDNLLVEGSLEVQGRLFNLGTSPTNPDEPALTLQIVNGTTFANYTTSPSVVWTWGTPFASAMRLTSDNYNVTLTVNNSPVLTAASAATQFMAAQPSKLTIGSLASASAGSIAAGSSVQATGINSGAFGLGTIAQGANQFVIGQYNAPDVNDSLFIVGNGASGTPSNAFVVKRTGDAVVKNKLSVGLGGLDVSFGGTPTILVGADTGLSTRTNGVAKSMSIAMPHFLNASEAPLAIIGGLSNGGDLVDIGGGVAGLRSPGLMSFYTRTFTSPIGERRMFINHLGAVGIGTDAHIGDFYENFGGLDISSSGAPGTLMLGAELNKQTRTNQTDKYASIVIPHYYFNARPVTAFVAVNRLNSNELHFGNGAGNSSATDIQFWTAENTTSPSPKRRLSINSIGGIAAGEGTASNYLGQFVVGTHNRDSVNALFVVGNGTDADGTGPNPPAYNNALEVRKDGSVHAKVLRVQESGDISMGGFQTGPLPFAGQ